MRAPRPRLAALACALLASSASAREVPAARVFRGATVHPASGAAIENGVVVVRSGRVVAVGRADEVAIPSDAVVHDLAGRVLIPGLVDTHSHVGLSPRPAVPANADANETSNPVTPEVRALDAILPSDPGIRMARAGGITAANVMPGSGNVVGGQTAYVKLRGGTVEEMLIRAPGGELLPGGMKMANGENPKRARMGPEKPAGNPATRMGAAFLERKLFVEALDYREKREGKEPPARDLRLEPMLEVLDGRRIVHHHTHRADDILTVLRIADEFGHRVVLQHATEAWLVADEIARREVPVSTLVVDAPGGKHEALNLRLETPAILERAGVKVALHTDDFITSSRLLLRMAALAVQGGMSEAGALRAVTLHAAEMLDLGARLGSLEPGKDADLVVLSGPPFSVRTRVLETWIEGEKVFDAADPVDRLYQSGGFGVAERYP
jgi:imidazolonepropionase-like amidohydrolase